MFISSHYTVEMPCEIEEIGAECYGAPWRKVFISVLPKGCEARGFHCHSPVSVAVYRSPEFGSSRGGVLAERQDHENFWHAEVEIDNVRVEDGWNNYAEISDQRNINLAHALLGAVELAKHLRGLSEQFEKSYLEAEAKSKRQREEARAQREAALAADPPIGTKNAELLLKRVRKAAKAGPWASISLPLINRGNYEGGEDSVGISREWGGPVCIRYRYKRTNQDHAKELLAESSFRAVKGILKVVREHEKKTEALEIHTHADTQPV